MQNRTVSAMFDTYEAAARAVNRLESAGVSADSISVVSRDPATPAATADDDGSGTASGATVGAVLGGGAGLLAGIGVLAIPGLGPLVAAGWLAATLAGATVGGAAGGLIGALSDAGVPEADAHAYAEGLRRGGTLITVRTDETQVALIADILDQEGTIDIDERTAAWRREGWTGRYSDSAPVGTPMDAARSTVPVPRARIYSTPDAPSVAGDPPRREAARRG